MFFRVVTLGDRALPTALRLGDRAFQIVDGGLLLAPTSAATSTGQGRRGDAVLRLFTATTPEQSLRPCWAMSCAYQFDSATTLTFESTGGEPVGHGHFDGRQLEVQFIGSIAELPAQTWHCTPQPDDPQLARWRGALFTEMFAWSVSGGSAWQERIVGSTITSGVAMTRPWRRLRAAWRLRSAWHAAV